MLVIGKDFIKEVQEKKSSGALSEEDIRLLVCLGFKRTILTDEAPEPFIWKSKKSAKDFFGRFTHKKGVLFALKCAERVLSTHAEFYPTETPLEIHRLIRQWLADPSRENARLVTDNSFFMGHSSMSDTPELIKFVDPKQQAAFLAGVVNAYAAFAVATKPDPETWISLASWYAHECGASREWQTVILAKMILGYEEKDLVWY